jgi:DNA-directed RNA polymerase specialized sigma24 family protein
MEKTKRKWRESGPTAHIEIILEEYYSQLLKWAALLTRGDSGVAQDIVHDLCLHFTLVKPDLSQVANMDGYLYTCLRHIYLSGLSRSAREAMRFVSVAEFDSIQFALGVTSAEGLMERQNDIRRICSYMVWRKETSKSASYFILHFFHGYGRKEIAEIACLPIAAIYNKLKTSRTEVKSHLAESGKLRIATRDIPPEPELLLRPLSSSALFDEIREAIWAAKTSECLDEEELLARYRAASPKPISCALLSHLVSCEPFPKTDIPGSRFSRWLETFWRRRRELDPFRNSRGQFYDPHAHGAKAARENIRTPSQDVVDRRQRQDQRFPRRAK